MFIRVGSNKPAHVPRETGQALVASGIATEVPLEKETLEDKIQRLSPRQERLTPQPQWQVILAKRVDDYQLPPYLYFHCATCHHKQVIRGKSTPTGIPYEPPTLQNCVIVHCNGFKDSPPQAILDRMTQLRTLWFKQHRKMTPRPQANDAALYDFARDRRALEYQIEIGAIDPKDVPKWYSKTT